jgi:hypothetical protein
MVGNGCACWGIDWHWLAQCGVPVRDRVWRVVAGYDGVSTFAAVPRHWRLDILLRAVKLRYGAGDPGICAQALSIGTGVDEEDCVAAAGPRTMAGAAEFGALCGKAWATEYLEGVAGAAGPVIPEAGGQRARESASAHVRIPRGSSDETATAPSCAVGTPFPEGSFASGGVVLVADAPRGAGAVNSATGSKRARPGYDEHAAAMNRQSGSRAEV